VLTCDGSRITTRLAELMRIGSGQEMHWRQDDLSGILDHQLQTPLMCDLRPDPGQLVRLREISSFAGAPPLNTFTDLLNHPSPPLWLVKLAKNFAKNLDGQTEHALPEEIASTMYLAAIALALVRLGERITALNDAGLIEGFKWVARQRWMPEGILALIREAIVQLTVKSSV
jgi:hypothetical protein